MVLDKEMGRILAEYVEIMADLMTANEKQEALINRFNVLLKELENYESDLKNK